jgi:hypothetical protein
LCVVESSFLSSHLGVKRCDLRDAHVYNEVRDAEHQ